MFLAKHFHNTKVYGFIFFLERAGELRINILKRKGNKNPRLLQN